MIKNTMSTTEISSLQSQQSNSTVNSITNTASASKSTTTRPASNTAQTTSSPAYSVNISKGGMLRNATTASTASASSSTTMSSAALTQYSDTQLKQMLSSGKITQSQYNMVMSGRANQKAETADASRTATANTAAAK